MSFGSVSKQETGVFPGKRSKQIRSEISCKENKDVAVQNYLKRKKKKEKSYFASDFIFNCFSPLTVV